MVKIDEQFMQNKDILENQPDSFSIVNYPSNPMKFNQPNYHGNLGVIHEQMPMYPQPQAQPMNNPYHQMPYNQMNPYYPHQPHMQPHPQSICNADSVYNM